MIDNYDSFTYNLVQYLGELGQDVRVYRNDKLALADIEKLAPDRIVISRALALPMRRAFRSRRSAPLRAGFRYWGFASATSRLVRLRRQCHSCSIPDARKNIADTPRRQKQFLPACRIRLRQRAITRLSLNGAVFFLFRNFGMDG